MVLLIPKVNPGYWAVKNGTKSLLVWRSGTLDVLELSKVVRRNSDAAHAQNCSFV